MFNKEKILKDIGLGDLIENPLIKNVSIIKVKRGNRGDLYGYTKGMAWYILSGNVEMTSYYEDDCDSSWDLKKGDWFGIANAVLKTPIKYEAEAYSDVVVLEVPINQILESEATSKTLLKKVVEILAFSVEKREERVAIRVGYGDELFFLKYLERNDFIINYPNLNKLSNILNINSRTFQRILKKLEESDIIYKTRGRIEVKKMAAYRKHLKDLSK